MDTDTESLLKKGLSFIPTTSINKFDLFSDLHAFFRRIRLTRFFEDKVDNREPNQSGLKPASTFTPFLDTVGPEVKVFENVVTEKIQSLLKFVPKPYFNLNKGEYQALQNLQKDKTTTVKPCDKGGGIVLLDTEVYKYKIQTMLNDLQYYQKTNTNWQQRVKREIAQITNEAYDSGLICHQELQYLNPVKTRTPVFYGVPKIHKNLTDPPMRPIVSTVGALTEPLSKYVESYLSPRVAQLPAYIRDTSHIIAKLEGHSFNPNIQLLVSMDIEALYTNIPQQEAWQAVASLFEKEGMTEHSAFVLQCLDIVLREHFFEFDNQIFQQKKGVSMGAACAPSVANIYVGSFEEKNFYNEIAPFFENIQSWSRFIDDIFFIWTGEEESLLEFRTTGKQSISSTKHSELETKSQEPENQAGLDPKRG
ncbi:hypothetical protein NDU88_009162 [Pleurodeles waltl]|uniref:Reverse transcriptase domain-containing protein n=1 Tax=Pleurodeles waltl TaxID=8319 RepID=A0AAV7PRZ1_PLEWA|nr:hypothetical protein NDU88_009162 [Pleurodeles waltl]